MDRGHQTLHNRELVGDDLGPWGKAIGGARSIAALRYITYLNREHILHGLF